MELLALLGIAVALWLLFSMGARPGATNDGPAQTGVGQQADQTSHDEELASRAQASVRTPSARMESQAQETIQTVVDLMRRERVFRDRSEQLLEQDRLVEAVNARRDAVEMAVEATFHLLAWLELYVRSVRTPEGMAIGVLPILRTLSNRRPGPGLEVPIAAAFFGLVWIVHVQGEKSPVADGPPDIEEEVAKDRLRAPTLVEALPQHKESLEKAISRFRAGPTPPMREGWEFEMELCEASYDLMLAAHVVLGRYDGLRGA